MADAAMLTTTCNAQPPPPGPDLDLARYQLTFDEPFDRLDVSSAGPGTRWIAHTPWNGDFGDARFIDPAPARPFTVKNGVLAIEMSRSTGRWESGLLASADAGGTGFTQSGGYFEMRAKLPAGPGVWPAFWLAAFGKPGEIVPEVDVLEYYGKFPSSYRATIHLWRDGKALYGKSSLISVPDNSLTDGFHSYGVAIDARSIIFYLDRHEVARMESGPHYLHPMFILVDLAAGSGWPIDGMHDPSVLMIDYVRAYRERGGAGGGRRR